MRQPATDNANPSSITTTCIDWSSGWIDRRRGSAAGWRSPLERWIMTAATATAGEQQEHEPPLVNEEESAYRQMDKRYRVRRVAVNTRQTRFVRVEPELDSELLDFDAPGIDADPRVRRLGPEEADMRALSALGGGQGEKKEACPRVYALRDRPGFFYISAALSPKVQARWARTCLARFSRSRHTNLTNLQRQQQQQQQPESSRDAPCSSSLWADAIHMVRQQQQASTADNDAVMDEAIRPFRALRWANIGQNYDWGRRRYLVDVTQRPPPDEQQQEESEEGGGTYHHIPAELKELVRAVVEPLGFPSMEAEAGIVNFYPADASMGGHVDDAEGALSHPVVSFSLGLAAIFLLGGATRAVAPIPILTRSGDCLVMGGASRLCFHGVPAILTEQARPPLLLQDAQALLASRFWEGGQREGEEEEACSEAEAALLARYLATSRVNFNLRQVWKGGSDRTEEAVYSA